MKRSWSFLGMPAPALLALALGGAGAPVAAQDGGGQDCEAARCAAEAEIAAQCPCDEATRHGQYVRCVAHAAKDLVPKECRGAVVRCAARSTCGKEGAVTCFGAKPGKCDKTTGTCRDDASVSCERNRDCAGTRCSVEDSAAECQNAGGTVGASDSCCADCAATIQCCVPSSPDGALIDGSPIGAFTCIVTTPTECANQSGQNLGAGSCTPNPCPSASSTTVPATTSTSATVATTTETTATVPTTTATTATVATTTETTATSSTSTATTSSSTTTLSVVGAFLNAV